jgi:HEPN domain-containing protein
MVKAPIAVAESWLRNANRNLSDKEYELSIYSLEMAVEIAFKAVLISINIDPPKVHDIRDTIRISLDGNKKISKQFSEMLDGYLSTFGELLSLRPMAGYGFEGNIESAELRKQNESLIPKCSRIVQACENEVKRLRSG